MGFLILLLGSLVTAFNSFSYDPNHYADFMDQYKSRTPVVCIAFNLDGAPLAGLSLRKTDFSNCSLRGADLSGTDLSKSCLKGVDFSGANLTKCTFNGATLKAAIFKGAKASHIKAKGTALEDEGFLRYHHIQFSPSPMKGQSLDLHGHEFKDIPQLLECFLSRAISHGQSTVEIVTGRGIHSPDGKRGKLHRFCKQYLRDHWQPYIKETISTSQDGAWFIVLKKHIKSHYEAPSIPSTIKGPFLDLHGHPFENIPRLLKDLLAEALHHNYRILTVVTGRGLHNTYGKRGKLHGFCEQYFRDIWGRQIRKMIPTNKNGAWKIYLKKKKIWD